MLTLIWAIRVKYQYNAFFDFDQTFMDIVHTELFQSDYIVRELYD